jgi:hypothetical protein
LLERAGRVGERGRIARRGSLTDELLQQVLGLFVLAGRPLAGVAKPVTVPSITRLAPFGNESAKW